MGGWGLGVGVCGGWGVGRRGVNQSTEKRQCLD